MYVCMYVCVCMCVCMYVRMYVCLLVNVHRYSRVFFVLYIESAVIKIKCRPMWVRVCGCGCMGESVCVCVCVCVVCGCMGESMCVCVVCGCMGGRVCVWVVCWCTFFSLDSAFFTFSVLHDIRRFPYQLCPITFTCVCAWCVDKNCFIAQVVLVNLQAMSSRRWNVS